MIGIQLLAILFALWMTYFTFLHFRRKEFSLAEFIVWQVLWLGLVVVVLFPKSVGFLLATFRINRTFDLVVIVGIMTLIASTFRNSVVIKRTSKKLEDIVRQQALEDARERHP